MAASNGTLINVGDPVCVSGECRAVTGSGQKATITVLLANNQLVQCQAGDCFATPGPGTAVTENGVTFGVGSQVTIKGTVSAVVVAGTASTVAVTTKSNSTVASVPPVAVNTSKAKSK